MEREFNKTNIMDNPYQIIANLSKYLEARKSISDGFDYDTYGFYLGIRNIKKNLSVEDIIKLMEICSSCATVYLNPMYLAEELTMAVYSKEYLSLEDLEKIPSEDIIDILNEDKLYLLKNYSSKEQDYER